ncbi:ABC transporter G family member 20-like isoform X2 [Artemia franciscana]|uniref:ABC transporter G family member 20-like isoform X2 n=1 Tax=Artemia franciscana TaxID=6661 RepID=UPI0032DA2EC2
MCQICQPNGCNLNQESPTVLVESGDYDGIVLPSIDDLSDKAISSTVSEVSVSDPSVSEPDSDMAIVDAVYVRNAVKSYGVGKKRSHVLKSLDMTLRKGTIYGLLGASGCGKTTLLSCIVGRRRLDSGEILVFGGEPGTKQSGIPGRRVGYMPQELALYGEFTISETLEYFGRIYSLPKDFVKVQKEFLRKLLDLPDGNRYVKTLSGGQQRRVSFAVALFHEPELLILDEPTVGVDPLLRQSIWDHLVSLVREQHKTVIITTHYIEEARQANTIGMMRSGRLLAEESPQTLLSIYNLPSLEDVFLRLCMVDVSSKNNAATISVITDGVDNPAFAGLRSVSFRTSKNADGQEEEDSQKNMKHLIKYKQSLSGMNVAPTDLNKGYWKKSDSVYTPEEKGIVGLTFSPSGDNLYDPCTDKDQNLLSDELAHQCSQSSRKDNRKTETADASPVPGHNFRLNRSEENLFRPSSTPSLDQRSHSDNSSAASTPGQKTKKNNRSPYRFSLPSAHRSSALIRKNVMQTFRNIGVFLFVFLLPAVEAILFCLAIGNDPTYLKVAVVNDEFPNATQGMDCPFFDDCTYEYYSCRFLRHIDNQTIVKIPYPTVDLAQEAAKKGDVWAVIHMPQNFTDEIMVRNSQGSDSDMETIIGSQISVNMDWTNQQISLIIQRRLMDAFEDFQKDILTTCELEEAAGTLPLQFINPIYGEPNPSFMHFMAPGVILTILYFIAVALTAAVFINERKQGLLDRSLVAGVTMTEVLFAHLANQLMTLIGQTVLVLVTIFVVFQVPCNGNIMTVSALSLLQGLCGMCFGLLISCLCDEETSAIHFAVGSFYPNLLLSGVMWPIEGMPTFMREFSYFLPQTYAVESMRNVIARGWDVDNPEVYLGVVCSVSWALGLLFLSAAVIRIRKYTG